MSLCQKNIVYGQFSFVYGRHDACACSMLADAVRNASFVVVGNVTSEAMTSSVMYAGDELECRAFGNPSPTYSVTTEPTS